MRNVMAQLNPNKVKNLKEILIQKETLYIFMSENYHKHYFYPNMRANPRAKESE